MRSLLTTAVLLVAVTPVSAQPGTLRGIWYLSGDPTQPCRIDVRSNPDAPLVFTNEKGETSPGRLDPGGVVYAYTWGPTGQGLAGRLTPGAIQWDNGSVWTRYPSSPVDDGYYGRPYYGTPHDRWYHDRDRYWHRR